MPYSNTYTSPADAVSDQLQQILAQKRLDARQKMLDDLNNQNIQSEMAYRQANQESLADQRAAHAEQLKADAQAKKQKADREDAVLSGMDTYIGSPDFALLPKPAQNQIKILRAARDVNGLNQVMTGLNQTNPDMMVPGMMVDPENPKQLIPEVGPDGKPYMVKKGTPPQMISRPPRTPVDHGTFVGQAQTPDGKPIPGRFVVMVNGHMRIEDQPEVPGIFKPPAGGGGKVPPSIRPGTWTQYQMAAQAAKADPNGENQAIQDLWTQQGLKVIDEYNLDPHIKAAISEAFKNKQYRTSGLPLTAATFSSYDDKTNKAVPIPPDQLQAASQLWGLLTGK